MAGYPMTAARGETSRRRQIMRVPAWAGIYEAGAYRNPPGSSMQARVLMEAEHDGFEIAQVDTLEHAQVIADALNLYAQVVAMVQEQEREDAVPPITEEL
jgi:hypothetical protein